MTHIPVSVGKESSREGLSEAGASSRTRTRADLIGVMEVGAQRVGDAEASGDHPRNVGRRGADPLDRVGDPQHAGHPLGILGTSRGEHRHRPQAPQQIARSAVETDRPRRRSCRR